MVEFVLGLTIGWGIGLVCGVLLTLRWVRRQDCWRKASTLPGREPGTHRHPSWQT